ncbi:MAG: hypothetical protein L3J82_05425 [Planctomycetes bacterium]|nr:hypothetical protein [Planctomycetota bacterium]
MKTMIYGNWGRVLFFGAVSLMLILAASVGTIQADELPEAEVDGTGSAKKKNLKRVKLNGSGEPVVDGNGKIVYEDASVPDGATKIKGKTSASDGIHQGGEIFPVVINKSGSNATDLHFYVKSTTAGDKAIRIGSIDINKTNHPMAETVGVLPGSSPANGAGTGIQVPPGETGAIADKHTTDPDNKEEATVKVSLIIEIWENGEWKRYKDKNIEIYAWWTMGAARDKNITVCMPDNLGSGDDRTAIVNVHSDANLGPLLLEAGFDPSATYTLNDIALGETDNHRFMSGSIVISPNDGAVFAEDIDGLEILAFSEDGLEVTSSEVFSFAEPRVDGKGNFVFEIERSTEDTNHICFIIKGLKLTKLPELEVTGQAVGASVSGAVFGDRKFSNVWELIKITD